MQLLEECETIKEREREEEIELERLENIKMGKIYLKRKKYHRAIESFESAFRMKMDKDVFMFLAHIYKMLKSPRELEDLLFRWNQMVEHEEKMKKFRHNHS